MRTLWHNWTKFCLSWIILLGLSGCNQADFRDTGQRIGNVISRDAADLAVAIADNSVRQLGASLAS